MADTSDIIFVVLDGVRRDRVSLFENERKTTPHLDEFAESAVVFENAYTPAPWTVPSHTSMFTGKAPSEHGVTNAFSGEPLGLSQQEDLLAEKLSKSGYRTAGLSNNPWIGRTTGLNRGFDLFVEWDLEFSVSDPSYEKMTGEKVQSRLHSVIGTASRQPLALVKHRHFTSRLLETAQRWITNSTESSFTFLNLMGAHTPFYPPKSSFKSLSLDSPTSFESRRLNIQMLRGVLDSRGAGDFRDRVLDYYDASVHYQDQQLNSFLEELKNSGHFDNSLIVVCADHGKTLGEFDRSGTPPHYLRDVNAKVPLVVKFPEQIEGIREEKPIELTRIFDLLLADDYSVSEVSSFTKDYAFVEDFIPHTGSEATSVSRWRGITDGNDKFVKGENGEKFLLEGTAGEESIIEDESRIEEYQVILEDRTSKLETEQTSADPDGEAVSERVESQLKDLGYMQ